jgi:hypothetical protein
MDFIPVRGSPVSSGEERDIDLLLASLRADAHDAHAFLQALATKLDGALPGQVRIGRHGGLFAREKPVQRLKLELDEFRHAIEDAGQGRLKAERTHVVRGIALKTEPLGVEEWIERLAAGLAEAARRGAGSGLQLAVPRAEGDQQPNTSIANEGVHPRPAQPRLTLPAPAA